MFTRKRIGIAVAAMLVPLLAPSVVAAQGGDGPTVSCGGDANISWPGVGFEQLVSVVYSTTATGPNKSPYESLAVDIPAGVYGITTAAYDGGTNRSADVQPQEQFALAFYDASNVLIDRTPLVTTDLLDGVEEAEWAGSLGSVVLDRAATRIQAEHASLFYPADPHPNSVMPVCAGWALEESVTTTTEAPVTTTTEAPTTTTTTEAPVATTTVAPPTAEAPTTTTTTAPTTTTVQTQVLPAVETSPDPAPVVGNPTFTG